MDEAAIERAAMALAEVRLGRRRRLAELPQECRPPDLDVAYQVQDALHRRLADGGLGPLAGHKIGCTTAVMQRFLGIDHPCAGGLFASMVQHGKGTLRHDRLVRPGVECEIAVQLATDLPSPGAACDREAAAAAVGTCMAAIEVVDDRYQDYRSLDTPTLVADDFFNAAAVLGPPVADWRELDLARLKGRMTIGGAEVGAGRGGDILGHPLDALAWLAGAFTARGKALKAGQFVLLGSVVQTQWVERGDVMEVTIEGLGSASCTFT